MTACEKSKVVTRAVEDPGARIADPLPTAWSGQTKERGIRRDRKVTCDRAHERRTHHRIEHDRIRRVELIEIGGRKRFLKTHESIVRVVSPKNVPQQSMQGLTD